MAEIRTVGAGSSPAKAPASPSTQRKPSDQPKPESTGSGLSSSKTGGGTTSPTPGIETSSRAGSSREPQLGGKGSALAGPSQDTFTRSSGGLALFSNSDSEASTPLPLTSKANQDATQKPDSKNPAGGETSKTQDGAKKEVQGASPDEASASGAEKAPNADAPKKPANTPEGGDPAAKSANEPTQNDNPAKPTGSILDQLIAFLRTMGLNDAANQLSQNGKLNEAAGTPSGGGLGAADNSAVSASGSGGVSGGGGGPSQAVSGGTGGALVRGGAQASGGGDENAGNTAGASVGANGKITLLGQAGQVSDQELQQAAGGNQQIIATLKKVSSDPEGAKALRKALDNGTTFKAGNLAGDVVGLTEFKGGNGPVITLENPDSVDTAAHELAHAAFPDMDHKLVYEFGHQVAGNLGEPVNNGGGVPAGI